MNGTATFGDERWSGVIILQCTIRDVFQRATRAAATAVAEVINAAGLPKEQPH
jgi:hypothetical protein